MATTIGPWFDKVFFDSHGKPCAGGTIFFYQTGTDVPSPVATADGTLLGASVKLDDDGRPDTDFRFYADKIYRVVVVDAEGERVTQIDDVAIPESEGGAMYNPMTAQADIIVGGAGGEPTRLEGASSPSFLRSMNSVVGKVLQWVGLTGSNGVKVTNGTSGTEIGLDTTGASEGDVPRVTAGGGIAFGPVTDADEKVKVSATDASSGYLDDKLAVEQAPSGLLHKLTYTDGGGNKSVAFGIDAAGSTNGQVITSRMGFPKWEDIPTQSGDHKTAVDGSDTSPDYLAAKLAAGSGISLTNTGSAVSIAADTQEGDHHVLVTGADASAGTLADKLVAGSNVTLTPLTDGDGVQTLEIDATGGGGGGADNYHLQYPDHKIYVNANYITFVKVPGIILPQKIGSWTFWPRESPTTLAGFRCWCALFEERDNSQNINISSFTYPVTPPTPSRNGDPITFNFDSLVTIDKTKLYRVGIWFGGTGISSVFVNAPQTAQDSGNWTWFGGGYASATPPANTSGLSTSSITEVPWFSLNERTI